jgi:hypothetical protein
VSTVIAALLRPFAALIFLGLIVLPIALLLKRWIPPGRMKDFLYKKRVSIFDMPFLPREGKGGSGRNGA